MMARHDPPQETLADRWSRAARRRLGSWAAVARAWSRFYATRRSVNRMVTPADLPDWNRAVQAEADGDVLPATGPLGALLGPTRTHVPGAA